MANTIPDLERLIEKFRKLPGVGRRSAERMAYRILDMPEADAEDFAKAITDAKRNITKCSICFNLCQGEICGICSDNERDHSVICVLEDARAAASLEKVREYRGLYHILEGTISPMDGIGPEKLRIKELLDRVGEGTVEEIIIATNSTVEGETTAMYLAKLLRPLGLKITRLAYGIPVGGELDHADDMTLARAIDGRREVPRRNLGA